MLTAMGHGIPACIQPFWQKRIRKEDQLYASPTALLGIHPNAPLDASPSPITGISACTLRAAPKGKGLLSLQTRLLKARGGDAKVAPKRLVSASRGLAERPSTPAPDGFLLQAGRKRPPMMSQEGLTPPAARPTTQEILQSCLQDHDLAEEEAGAMTAISMDRKKEPLRRNRWVPSKLMGRPSNRPGENFLNNSAASAFLWNPELSKDDGGCCRAEYHDHRGRIYHVLPQHTARLHRQSEGNGKPLLTEGEWKPIPGGYKPRHVADYAGKLCHTVEFPNLVDSPRVGKRPRPVSV